MNNSSVGGRSLDVTPNIVLLFTSNRASPKKELFLPLTETYSFHDNCYAVRYVHKFRVNIFKICSMLYIGLHTL